MKNKKLPCDHDDLVARASIRCGEVHVVDSVSAVVDWQRRDKLLEIVRLTSLLGDDFTVLNFVYDKLRLNSVKLDVVKLSDTLVRNTYSSGRLINQLSILNIRNEKNGLVGI